MVFTKRLRPGIRSGRIRCTIRIWTSLKVKVGGRYPMEDGHVVVDSIAPIRMQGVTDDLARESGFSDVEDLLGTAKHGSGHKIFLIRFHYLAPGAWDVGVAPTVPKPAPESRSTLLRRIRAAPSASSAKNKATREKP